MFFGQTAILPPLIKRWKVRDAVGQRKYYLVHSSTWTEEENINGWLIQDHKKKKGIGGNGKSKKNIVVVRVWPFFFRKRISKPRHLVLLILSWGLKRNFSLLVSSQRWFQRNHKVRLSFFIALRCHLIIASFRRLGRLQSTFLCMWRDIW